MAKPKVARNARIAKAWHDADDVVVRVAKDVVTPLRENAPDLAKVQAALRSIERKARTVAGRVGTYRVVGGKAAGVAVAAQATALSAMLEMKSVEHHAAQRAAGVLRAIADAFRTKIYTAMPK